MNIQLTDIKYEIVKTDILVDDKVIDTVKEMKGYTVALILNENINVIMEISTCKELTIKEIKEDIQNQLANR